jgi:hypothetical protein
MCDTFTFFSKSETGQSFFAKNSDRDPGEPQIIEFITDAKSNFDSEFLTEKLPKYQPQLNQLRKIFPLFEHPYAAIISRPTWIWGAEMGINSKGLAIGNEAVFSKQKLNKDGLLGMDILRLALHNAANADEAVDFIIKFLEKYGQGGNGSYSGTLKYHNSFLIKDINKAFILESSAKNWALKEINDFASISNCYTLNTDYTKTSKIFQNKNIKKSIESKFYTFFSQGNLRKNYTSELIKSQAKSLLETMSVLRSHINDSDEVTKGMKSICVHPGTLVKSETTSSMIVDYKAGKQIIWHTSSPNPCVSIFKPMILTESISEFSQFQTIENSLSYFKENREMAEFFIKNYSFFISEIKALRDRLETEFIARLYTNFENKTEKQLITDCMICYEKEKEYGQYVKRLFLEKGLNLIEK